MSVASTTITVLDLFIYFISIKGWRWVWRLIPAFSDTVFPDLNGIWEGSIIFEDQRLAAKARIRQNWWRIAIDLHSETSKSHTLVAYPIKEAENPKLYYIYHNEPQDPNFPEYKGTSILVPRMNSKPMRLSGHYFTVRGTVGRIELSQISFNPAQDFALH